MGREADVHGAGVNLVLADHWLGLSGEADLVQEAVAIMVPPCRTDAVRRGNAEWTVVAGVTSECIDSIDEAYADRPFMTWPPRGPRIAILDTTNGCLDAAGEFRTGTRPARISVDRRRHVTTVEITDRDVASRRWPDWLARVFFGSRLLASGWMLLHASAVRLAGGAVICVAGPMGGKSTFAHRACVELGAHLMADDLVFVKDCEGEVQVVGWPTRIALPADLAGSSEEHLPDAEVARNAESRGLSRARVLLTPAEHRRLLGIPHAGAARLAGTVVLDTLNETSGRVQTALLPPSSLIETLVAACDIPGQRLYLTDLLGLVGGVCQPAGPVLDDPMSDALLKRPAVRLCVEGPRHLSRVPMWSPLQEHLPVLVTHE